MSANIKLWFNLELTSFVSDNYSSQFPRQPEMHPLAATPNRLQQIFSFVLIITGLILLGMGGWMYYQYQLEASKPPPARILEVSVTDSTDTPQPRPVTATSTAVVKQIGNTQVISSTPAKVATSTATPKPTQTVRLFKLTPFVTPSSTVTPRPTATPLPTTTPLPANTQEAGSSLADNPLVVEEEATPAAPVNTPAPAATPVVNSPITRIVAPSIGLDTAVIEVGWKPVTLANGATANVWVVADYAAGWHKNSALPGQGGNIVLSGHHNINGEVFRHTIDLNVGDIITLYEGDQTFDYAVVDKFIVKDKGEPEAVRRENAKWIGPFNEERLTLVTCWPYTNNTHRAIVIAKPVTPQ